MKAPLFPFHTWAPKVYANSPILVSMMLVAFK
ncbi:proton-conducting transporter membrane subunit, partial [Campylobacter coli]